MRDKMPSVANSDAGVISAYSSRYKLQNSDNTLVSSGNPYPNFAPDYKPRPFAGMRRFFRFTQGPQLESSPSELQILKIGLQNPLGNIYTAVPTGRQVPITFFAPQPFGQRWSEGPIGEVRQAPVEVQQGAAKTYMNIVNSIVRRR